MIRQPPRSSIDTEPCASGGQQLRIIETNGGVNDRLRRSRPARSLVPQLVFELPAGGLADEDWFVRSGPFRVEGISSAIELNKVVG